MSATYTGVQDMDFVYGDDVDFTVTVDVAGVTDLSSYTVVLTFTSKKDGTTFTKDSSSDTDWIDNKSTLTFDVVVDSSPTTVVSGESYTVKGHIVDGVTLHYLGSGIWRFISPPGGALPSV
jgi:hypothetical protein